MYLRAKGKLVKRVYLPNRFLADRFSDERWQSAVVLPPKNPARNPKGGDNEDYDMNDGDGNDNDVVKRQRRRRRCGAKC